MREGTILFAQRLSIGRKRIAILALAGKLDQGKSMPAPANEVQQPTTMTGYSRGREMSVVLNMVHTRFVPTIEAQLSIDLDRELLGSPSGGVG